MELAISFGLFALYILVIVGFYLLYSSMIRKALGMEEDFVPPFLVRMAIIALAILSPAAISWALTVVFWLIGSVL